MKSSIILTSLLLSALPAFAGTTAPSLSDTALNTPDDSGWNVRIASYGWFTSMHGDIAVKGNVAPVDVKFTDIIDKIDFSFMGVVEIGRGKWSLATDLFYAKLSADNSRNNTEFSAEMEQFMGTTVIVRNLVDDGTTRFDVFAGARVNYLSSELEIDRPLPFPDTNVSASKTWVDPIIGIRAQRDLTDKLFLRGVFDIGGFGITSDLTWQAYAAFGYRISEQTSISIGYRGLGTDYTDGGFTYDVVSHGLLLGLEHRF